MNDFDIRPALESPRDVLSLGIAEVMNASPKTIRANMRAVDTLEFMRRPDKPIAVVPVVDDAKIAVGMVHLHDLVQAGL